MGCKKLFLLVSIISIFIISGCKNEEQVIVAPSLTGEITGSVNVLDYFLLNPEPRDSVKITLVGTSYTAYTDSMGKFTLKNVPAGIYDILYKKNGYSYTKIFNQQFVGNGKLYLEPAYIYELPEFKFETITLEQDTSSIKINVKVTGFNEKFYGIVSAIFAGTDSLTLSDDISTHSMSEIIYGNADNISIDVVLSYSFFYSKKFKSGDKIYLVLYPSTIFSTIIDPETKRTIYTGLTNNPSKKVSFVLP
ncbi:MAG: carboxypeptidase-like regulatory domain-containing protein [Methanococcaceae archaeon]